MKTTAQSIRCAIYARVSTPNRIATTRNTHNQDLNVQLTPLREYAARQGWTVHKEYCDRESGSKSSVDRPQFKQLLADAQSHRPGFTVVLFYNLDRLSREGVFATHQYLDIFSRNKIQFHSLCEPFLSTLGPFGDVVISLLAALAKQERIRLSERVKAGLENARRRGSVLGRKSKVLDEVALKKLVDSGGSLTDIAKVFGIGRATAQRKIKQLGIITAGMGELAALRAAGAAADTVADTQGGAD